MCICDLCTNYRVQTSSESRIGVALSSSRTKLPRIAKDCSTWFSQPREQSRIPPRVSMVVGLPEEYIYFMWFSESHVQTHKYARSPATGTSHWRWSQVQVVVCADTLETCVARNSDIPIMWSHGGNLMADANGMLNARSVYLLLSEWYIGSLQVACCVRMSYGLWTAVPARTTFASHSHHYATKHVSALLEAADPKINTWHYGATSCDYVALLHNHQMQRVAHVTRTLLLRLRWIAQWGDQPCIVRSTV